MADTCHIFGAHLAHTVIVGGLGWQRLVQYSLACVTVDVGAARDHNRLWRRRELAQGVEQLARPDDIRTIHFGNVVVSHKSDRREVNDMIGTNICDDALDLRISGEIGNVNRDSIANWGVRRMVDDAVHFMSLRG